MQANSHESTLKPVGYSAILAKYPINLIPHHRLSYIIPQGRGYTKQVNNQEIVVYPKGYALQRPDNLLDNLEFAIKHDGINLAILSHIFKIIKEQEITKYINDKPTSKYRRKIWFLYEQLTGLSLKIPNLKSMNYINLLDEKQFYTGNPIKVPRYAINNNLLGGFKFCPFVRKTKEIQKYEKKNFSALINDFIKTIDPAVLVRVASYLYTKETKSSFGIERITPSRQRLEKFVKLLETAASIEEINKDLLINLQNSIVDAPYKDTDYRKTQNYVGELTPSYQQKIHYISPKPEDVPDLMTGLEDFANSIFNTDVHPVIIASALAFGFVFIHPFEDGNGRIHRFLIHYVLAKTGFAPHNMIFPVSAVMLKNIKQYDKILESFSEPLLSAIENYHLNNDGELSVTEDTRLHYQYIDFTLFAEYLFGCIERTINEDFKEELIFIQQYDKTKAAIQNIIDMPDLKIDRIIRCIKQNEWHLGEKMKKTYFQELDENVIREIENVVKKYMR